MMKRILILAIIALAILTGAVMFQSVHADSRWAYFFGVRPGGILESDGNLVATPVSLAGAVTTTVPSGTVFKFTGTAKCTRLLGGSTGRIVILSTTSTDTLVDGVNLKLAGNFNGTADDVITLVYGVGGAADTSWYEISRAVN